MKPFLCDIFQSRQATDDLRKTFLKDVFCSCTDLDCKQHLMVDKVSSLWHKSQYQCTPTISVNKKYKRRNLMLFENKNQSYIFRVSFHFMLSIQKNSFKLILKRIIRKLFTCLNFFVGIGQEKKKRFLMDLIIRLYFSSPK